MSVDTLLTLEEAVAQIGVPAATVKAQLSPVGSYSNGYGKTTVALYSGNDVARMARRLARP
jgi:hypothetical protein